MSARYTYWTTLEYSTGNVPEVDEVDVEVSYTVVWGRPETPPAYDHGGLPDDPDEVNDITLISIDGVVLRALFGPAHGPFEQEAEAAILQQIAQCHYHQMLEEASQMEAAWEE